MSSDQKILKNNNIAPNINSYSCSVSSEKKIVSYIENKNKISEFKRKKFEISVKDDGETIAARTGITKMGERDICLKRQKRKKFSPKFLNSTDSNLWLRYWQLSA